VLIFANSQFKYFRGYLISRNIQNSQKFVGKTKTVKFQNRVDNVELKCLSLTQSPFISNTVNNCRSHYNVI